MFVKNYLENRCIIAIKHNGNMSGSFEATSKVSQGSDLEPLLFLLFFNDLRFYPYLNLIFHLELVYCIVFHIPLLHTTIMTIIQQTIIIAWLIQTGLFNKMISFYCKFSISFFTSIVKCICFLLSYYFKILLSNNVKLY